MESGMPYASYMALHVLPSLAIERAPMSSENNPGSYQDIYFIPLKLATVPKWDRESRRSGSW